MLEGVMLDFRQGLAGFSTFIIILGASLDGLVGGGFVFTFSFSVICL